VLIILSLKLSGHYIINNNIACVYNTKNFYRGYIDFKILFNYNYAFNGICLLKALY
jgi:hypothetical protein